MNELTTCLWFDTEGEEAAKFYVDLFPNSRLGDTMTYLQGERAGQAMTVEFELNGSKFVALNGGPDFTFNEAMSFQIPCADQAEVDRYWERAHRWWRGGAVRLAQGSLRRVLAGHPGPADGAALQPGSADRRAGHPGDVRDEEDGDCGP